MQVGIFSRFRFSTFQNVENVENSESKKGDLARIFGYRILKSTSFQHFAADKFSTLCGKLCGKSPLFTTNRGSFTTLMILYTNLTQIASFERICAENKERNFSSFFMQFDNIINTVWNLFFSINAR